jgi:hypothetical protein
MSGSRQREPVPPEVFDGMDEAVFQRSVETYRAAIIKQLVRALRACGDALASEGEQGRG